MLKSLSFAPVQTAMRRRRWPYVALVVVAQDDSTHRECRTVLGKGNCNGYSANCAVSG
jgi:hypothetical protein